MLTYKKLVHISTRKEAERMKRVGVLMDDDLHKKLKCYAVNQEKSVTEIIISLVKKEIDTKKEQSR